MEPEEKIQAHLVSVWREGMRRLERGRQLPIHHHQHEARARNCLVMDAGPQDARARL